MDSSGHIGNPASKALTDRSFWCFISYRHSDNSIKGREWATWLHHELETFEVPDSLVGTSNDWGVDIPSRIYPVFRDEEELPAFADLSSAILHALEHSRSLIVICSPAARASKFVNEEVARFKSLDRAERVCGMVIRGEPRIDSSSCCLPLPLVRRVGPDGTITSIPEQPSLVDLREADGVEGWHDKHSRQEALIAAGMSQSEAAREASSREERLREAKLFLVSWVLGVSLHRLQEAHERRLRSLRRGRYAVIASWSLLAVLVAAAAWLGVNEAIKISQKTNEIAGKAAEASSAAEKAIQETVVKAAESGRLRMETLYAEAMGLEQANRWDEAVALLTKAGEEGHLPSKVELARLVAEGRGTPRDSVAAARLLEAALAAGHLPARPLLGRLLAASETEPATKARGIELLRLSYAGGDRSVALDLAKAVMASNSAEAISLLRADAQSGVAESAWLLGGLLKKEAVAGPHSGEIPNWHEWWSRAADAGYVPAKRDAGYALWDGSMGPANAFDLTTRRTALRRLIEAVYAGDHKASACLEDVFKTHSNLPVNPDEARDFLMEGAKAGAPSAMLGLAEMYDRKAMIIDGGEFRAAVDWYGRARQAGLFLPSQLGHASLILRIATPKDSEYRVLLASALAMFIEAANAGSVDGMIGAAEVLQLQAGPDSSEQAESWLRKAESRDSRKARRLLGGMMIRLGNAREATSLLGRCVELGDGEAALMLGDWMFSHAQGREQLALTLAVFEKGAAAGNGQCALRCAGMFKKGQGTLVDRSKAEAMELMAAETGDPLCMLERGRNLLASNDSKLLPEAYAWLSMASSAGRSKECAPLLARASSMLGADRLAVAMEVQKGLMRRLRKPDSGAIR